MTRDAKTNLALVIETFVLCVLLVGAWATTGLSEYYAQQAFNTAINHIQDMNQYAYLADALIHGHSYLDIPVADGLLEASNPYDYSLRYELGANGEQIYWDYAFFEGKYYCYFGVIPALLLYVPYQLLTGDFLNTSYACIFLALLVVVAAAYLARKLLRTFFASTAGGACACIALLLLFFGSDLVYLVSVPCFYSIPYLSSLLFTFLGLGLWLSAKGSGNHSKLSAWRLFLGSLFMAMSLGCRPHFMLACFLALPIFWDEIRHKRTLFSRKSLKDTLCALLPFVLVVAPLLAYNYVRFGSPFDLGSQYNLTGYDMAGYAQDPLSTLYLAYQYLLQPMDFSDSFPFIRSIDLRWPLEALYENPVIGLLYALPLLAVVLCLIFMAVRGIVRARVSFKILALGVMVLLCTPIVASLVSLAASGDFASGVKEAVLGFAPREPYFGGFLWLMPCFLLLLLVPRAYRFLRTRQPSACGLMVCCIAFTGIALLVDARMCGLTMRYWADFGWYLAVVGIFAFMSCASGALGSSEKSELGSSAMSELRTRVFWAFVFVLLLVTLIFASAWVFAVERYCCVAAINPTLWSMIVG